MRKYCNLYNCWCEAAKEVAKLDQAEDCDFVCEDCDQVEEI